MLQLEQLMKQWFGGAGRKEEDDELLAVIDLTFLWMDVSQCFHLSIIALHFLSLKLLTFITLLCVIWKTLTPFKHEIGGQVRAITFWHVKLKVSLEKVHVSIKGHKTIRPSDKFQELSFGHMMVHFRQCLMVFIDLQYKQVPIADFILVV